MRPEPLPQLARPSARPSGREPVRTFVVRGSEFEVAQRYSLIKGVGKGAYVSPPPRCSVVLPRCSGSSTAALPAPAHPLLRPQVRS
eukprot:COSAG04_NODE_17410_length_470_cov_0.797844_1_plen_85_part_01